MGTNDWIYNLFDKKPVPIAPNWNVDVRDIARGHVAAAEKALPPTLSQADRRFIVNPAPYTWKQAVEHLLKARPALKDRLLSLDEIELLPAPPTPLITKNTKEILGLENYINPNITFEQAVDDLLLIEKSLK